MKSSRMGIWMGVVALLGAQSACGGGGTSAATAPLESENQIANPSFEIANPSNPARPASWTPSVWGTNSTTFTYATSGHTGSRSVRIDMTSYASGDAKWIFDAVPVAYGSTYVYRDYYRSNVSTKLVAESRLADGTRVYQTLGSVPSSSGAWATAAISFAPAPNAVLVTVYHLISGVGTLLVDDASFSILSPETPDMTSGVPNGSFEQASDVDSNRPLAWRSDAWGVNQPTFRYAMTGHSGTRSVLLSMASYTSGDAKWYFDPQPVVPGTVYLFSDYYVATTDSFIIVRVTLSNGSYSYINLGTVPASASYTQAQASFVAPLGAVSATVFHGLAAVGSLQIDDAALSIVPVSMVNGVPNGSLEQTAFPGASLPVAWYRTGWGTNARSFSYAAEGYESSRSVRIDVSSYTSGSAAWTFDPQPVTGGQAYRVGDYYRSNVDTDVVAGVTLTDGTLVWQQLPVAFAAATWTRYSTVLYTPANAVTLAIYHRLRKVGYLETDDYSLLPTTPQPFARALVSLTFDDSWRTTYDNALPVLSRHSAVSTQYVLTESIGDAEHLTLGMLAELKARGHEIASHTVSHPDLTTLSPEALYFELQVSRDFLDDYGLGPVVNFAGPYGIYDTRTLGAIRSAYQSHRTTDVGYNTKDDFDVYRLKVQNVRATTTAAEMGSWVDQAAKDRSWLILVYHDVTDVGGSIYSTTTSDLDAHLAAIQSRGVAIVTVQQAMAELVPQL